MSKAKAKIKNLIEVFGKDYMCQSARQITDCCQSFEEGVKFGENLTTEEIFEWLTTQNYVTDLKETMIENFNNYKNQKNEITKSNI